MYFKNFYKNKSLVEIIEDIKKEGFSPQLITDTPNYIYDRHSHKETKLLAFIDGEVCVTVGETHYVCTKGDKLLIDGGIAHSARVGDQGCTFYWAEKLI